MASVLSLALLAHTTQSVSAGAALRARGPTLASIKPIHSLIAGVLEGVEVPQLLILTGASPHNYTLKPSDVAKLNRAGVLFVVSPLLERSLEKARVSLTLSARIIDLSATPGLTLYRVREGGAFDHHDHGRADEHSETNKLQAADAKTLALDLDTHIWLDPVNAGLIIRHVAKVMGELRPDALDVINANATRLIHRLKRLTGELETKLRPLAVEPYVVFHDAYQYFERRFGLAPIGSVTLGTDQLPGARRIMTLRKKLAAFGRACVFSEPQFRPRLVAVIVEGTKSRTAVLDPMGAALQPGPELYFKLIRNLASGFRGCLVGAD